MGLIDSWTLLPYESDGCMGWKLPPHSYMEYFDILRNWEHINHRFYCQWDTPGPRFKVSTDLHQQVNAINSHLVSNVHHCTEWGRNIRWHTPRWRAFIWRMLLRSMGMLGMNLFSIKKISALTPFWRFGWALQHPAVSRAVDILFSAWWLFRKIRSASPKQRESVHDKKGQAKEQCMINQLLYCSYSFNSRAAWLPSSLHGGKKWLKKGFPTGTERRTHTLSKAVKAWMRSGRGLTQSFIHTSNKFPLNRGLFPCRLWFSGNANVKDLPLIWWNHSICQLALLLQNLCTLSDAQQMHHDVVTRPTTLQWRTWHSAVPQTLKTHHLPSQPHAHFTKQIHDIALHSHMFQAVLFYSRSSFSKYPQQDKLSAFRWSSGGKWRSIFTLVLCSSAVLT